MKDPRRHHGFTILELVVVLAILVALATLLVTEIGGTRENAQAIAARSTMNTVREAFVGSSAGPGYLADMKYVPGFQVENVRTSDLLFFDSTPVVAGGATGRFPSAAANYDFLTQRGWHGPYISNARGHFPASGERRFDHDLTYQERGFFPTSVTYGTTGLPCVSDPWGNPIVVQIPTASSPHPADYWARIVSAGPDGILKTDPTDALAGMQADGTIRVGTDGNSVRGDDIVIFLNRADVYETSP